LDDHFDGGGVGAGCGRRGFGGGQVEEAGDHGVEVDTSGRGKGDGGGPGVGVAEGAGDGERREVDDGGISNLGMAAATVLRDIQRLGRIRLIAPGTIPT
jgi:hypothetical protein